MEDQFVKSLPQKEKKLYRMICAGFRMSQIAEELGVEKEKVQLMGQRIARMRATFYGAGSEGSLPGSTPA